MSATAFNVYRGGVLIDTVFFTGMTPGDVYESLVRHDSYPTDITVEVDHRQRPRGHVCDEGHVTREDGLTYRCAECAGVA